MVRKPNWSTICLQYLLFYFSVKTIFFVYSSDGSDESACSVDEDPNASPKCNQAECILPDCFCSADGTQVPGNLEITQVPQMITLSFNGAINQDNIPIYQDLFPEGMITKSKMYILIEYVLFFHF